MMVHVARVADASQNVHEQKGHPADAEADHDEQHPLGGPLFTKLESSFHAHRHAGVAVKGGDVAGQGSSRRRPDMKPSSFFFRRERVSTFASVALSCKPELLHVDINVLSV